MKRLIFTLVIAIIHMTHLSSSLDGKMTLYITPSSSTPCPAKFCLTLSQFARNSSIWLSLNTSMIFLPGNHTLNSDLYISNINQLSMCSNSTNKATPAIICQLQASFNLNNTIELWIKGLKFIGCGSTFSSTNNFTIENCTFQGHNNSGTAINIVKTNLNLANSFFVSNKVGSCLDLTDENSGSHTFVRIGGAIVVTNSNTSIINCSFLGNSAKFGGAIYAQDFSNIIIINSTFVNNQAILNDTRIQECSTKPNSSIYTIFGSTGGVIATFTSTLIIIESCNFSNNTSEAGMGGALSIQQGSFASIHNCEFYGNRVTGYGNIVHGLGGALSVADSRVTVDGSKFSKNSADEGGAMCIGTVSQITVRECVYYNNLARFSGGVMTITQHSQFFCRFGLFFNNRATTGGAFYAVRSELRFSDSVFSHNQAKDSGGVLFILQSQQQVIFDGLCNLTHNSAGTGGAIYAIESTLNVFRRALLTLKFNTASDRGGGVYLYRSPFNSEYASITDISCNKANISGGAIHAINSLITCIQSYYKTRMWPFQTFMIFANNSAHKGGGLYLESDAQLRLQKVSDDIDLGIDKLNITIYFTLNSAQYGAAVYVADETYFDVCSGTIDNTGTYNAECFAQVLSEAAAFSAESITTIEFTNNLSISNIIFGGLLDRCKLDPRSEIFTYGDVYKGIDGATYMKVISNIADFNHVSSQPVRVCFCKPYCIQPDCNYELPIVHVKKGERFNVSLVAVDQVNHTLKNVEIYSSLNRAGSSLGEAQSLQVTKDACTNLTFSIYSPHVSEQLILYAEGPCRNATRSQNRVHIVFEHCTCPIGFQTKEENNDCTCVCDLRLSPYFTDVENNCNFQTESLTRRGNFWITFINYTDSSSGFLFYPYCPLDYCLPLTVDVHIDLNLANGADAQCAKNRSGLLCAQCQPGLSLSYGSSRCISCSRTWYKGFVPVVLITLVAGILLVALLMTLNLTVAIGTLNGLIFYANIIGADSSTFFSGLSEPTKLYSTLISWLNLEVGFDVCFFQGMDTYWKTWLQLAFPTYVIFLVAIIIIVSEYSMKFSSLIAQRNPVATLATLILLSYTKFLQTTIATLSLAHLDYPDGSHKRAWLPDATVEYLNGKHAALFLVAIIILLIGIAFTCIVFFWQWLVRYQDRIIFKWTNSHKLRHFIEPYHEPHVSKHRYWTGLLLFTRIGLYLVFALNVSGDPGVNLLAITVSVVSLLLIKGHFGRVYKSSFVDVIEIAYYTNLCAFSAIRLKFGNDKIVDITAHISGVVTLVLLIVIICYHMCTTFCSNCLKRCLPSPERQLDESELITDNIIDSLSRESYRSNPTFPTVDLKLPVSDGKYSANDDDVSLISADSTSPLINNRD